MSTINIVEAKGLTGLNIVDADANTVVRICGSGR